MSWKQKQTAKNSDCEDLCSQLGDVVIQCLGNVDTAGLEDGDTLCYHAATQTFVNIPKEELINSLEVYVDDGSYAPFKINLLTNDGKEVCIDMSALPDDLCNDADFIAALTSKINTDNQNECEVEIVRDFSQLPSNDPYASAPANQKEHNIITENCIRDMKSGSLFTFSINASGDAITWGVNGNNTTVSILYPVVNLVEDASGGAHSLTVDGVVVATVTDADTISSLTTYAPNPTNGTDILVDGVVVYTIPDNDTISAVTTYELQSNGTTNVLVDGVVVYNIPDTDTDTVSPTTTYAPNAGGGTDVLVDGVIVYTIPDEDTVSPVTTYAPNPTNGTDILVDGVVVYTVPDNDTVSPATTYAANPNGGTDVLVNGTVVHTIPDTDVIINQTSPNEFTFTEGGDLLGVINTIPDTDHCLAIGVGVELFDGRFRQCFTTTSKLDGSTPNGPNDVCFDIPAPDLAGVNCAGNSINLNTEPLVTADEITSNGMGFVMPFVAGTPPCAPAPLTGKQAMFGGITLSPDGDVWRHPAGGGAPILENVNANFRSLGFQTSATGQTTAGNAPVSDAFYQGSINGTFFEADLQALQASGSSQNIVCVSRTLSNLNDCVPRYYRAFIRVQANGINFDADASYAARMRVGNNHTAAVWVGSPASQLNTSGYNVGTRTTMTGFMQYESIGVINAGESVTFDACLDLEVVNFSNLNGIQQFSWAGFGGRVEWYRGHPDILSTQ